MGSRGKKNRQRRQQHLPKVSRDRIGLPSIFWFDRPSRLDVNPTTPVGVGQRMWLLQEAQRRGARLPRWLRMLAIAMGTAFILVMVFGALLTH